MPNVDSPELLLGTGPRLTFERASYSFSLWLVTLPGILPTGSLNTRSDPCPLRSLEKELEYRKPILLAYVLVVLFIFINCFVGFAEGTSADWQFIYISDTHAGFAKTNRALEQFSSELSKNQEKYAFLVNTGDITELGTEDAFTFYLSQTVNWNLPIYNAIGNHDVRWSPFGKKRFKSLIGSTYYSFDYGGVHCIFLDTSIVHQTHGHVDTQQLLWLAKDLAGLSKDIPIFVFSHHAIRWTGISVDNGYEVLHLLDRFNAKVFFHGHSHNIRVLSWNGTTFVQNGALFNGDYMVIKVITGGILNEKKVVVEAKTMGELGGRQVASILLKPATEKTTIILSPSVGVNDVVEPREIWKKETGEIYAPLYVNNTTLLAANIFGKVFAFNSLTGALRWQVQVNGGVYAAPIIVNDEKHRGAYIATDEGKIYRLSLTNGKLLWESNAGSPVYGGLSRSDDMLFLGTASGELIGMSMESGEILWRTQLNGFTQGKPRLSGSGLFIGVWGNKFYALDWKTGDILWQKSIGKNIYYSPGIASPYAGIGRVIIPAKDNQVYAYNEKDGSTLWSLSIPAGYSSPVGTDGVVYITTQQGEILAIDENNGKRKWKTSLGTPFYQASPVIAGDHIVAASMDGYLYLLDRTNGALQWKYEISKGYVISTPVVSNGYVWVGSMDGTLYCLKLY